VTETAYPSFARMFEPSGGLKAPAYLVLMSLGSREGELGTAIGLCVSCMNEAGEGLASELREMLRDHWRPQIVACTALLIGQATESDIAEVWDALDRGSWASPQLVATASVIDPDFEAMLRTRLEPQKEQSLVSPPRRRDYKMTAALVAMAKQIGADWVDEEMHEPPASDVVRQSDSEDGKRISVAWLRGMQAALSVR